MSHSSIIYLFIVCIILQRWSQSPAEIVGSNPTWGMNVSCECCVLSGRDLCDELITSPGVLPSVVRRCVCYRNLTNEEDVARLGPQRHKKKISLQQARQLSAYYLG
jgi:hypothetical protein